MNTLAERLKESLDQSPEFTASGLARACGIKPPSVSDWLSGKTKKMEGANLLSASEYLGVNPWWLATGKGPMKISPEDTAAGISSRKSEIVIPQFETGGSMGSGLMLRDQPGIIENWSVSAEWLSKNVPHHTSPRNLAIVTGFGDSMKGMFNPGDPLLIDVGVTSCDFDGVYFFRVGEEGFIKRLQRIPGEGILAISENKAYRDWTIKPDMDFQVFGRVLKVWESMDF